MPRNSRHVGQGLEIRCCELRQILTGKSAALKYLDAGSDVPWQRVVSSTGKISSRGPGTTGAQRQREALEEEGVEVRVIRDGEFAVNWAECGWFPEHVDLDTDIAGAVPEADAEADADATDQQEAQVDGQPQH